MEFRKYEKIIRLGKIETDGILNGICVIQEKIDGANASIWLKDGVIQCGSRNRHLKNTSFNGFVEYANNHVGITKYLLDNPTHRLYGEWLVKHTISYNKEAYKKFYLFDILVDDVWLSSMEVDKVAWHICVPYPNILAVLKNPTIEELTKLVGHSSIADRGEGIVIKNTDFVNSFGDKVYAKMVTDNFKEDSSVAFGGNDKYASHYWEMYVVNKYITEARVKKIIQKLQPIIDERLGMKYTPRICESVWHDMIVEEMYDISKKVPNLNFKVCKRIAFKKSKKFYVEQLRIEELARLEAI